MKKEQNLLQILGDHTVSDLKNMAKEFQLKGYSKMKKDELGELLSRHILETSSMRMKFLVANDKEIALFEDAMNNEVVLEENSFSYHFWQDLCFAFVTTANIVKIPVDIQQEYERMKESKQYQEDRKRVSVIERYALACKNLYAVIDIVKFVQIINQQTELGVNQEEVITWCMNRLQCRGCNMYFYKDGYLMDDLYGDNMFGITENYRDMLARQGDKPYYIPEKEELLKYENDIYVEENEIFQKMVSFISSQMNQSKEEAYDFCAEIQLQIRDSSLPKQIIEDCNHMGLQFENMKQMNEFVVYLMEMFNHSRIPENRGYTASEISNMMSDEDVTMNQVRKEFSDMGFSFDYDNGNTNVIPFMPAKRSEPKVYPNDSCPCGSGKKFKKCCANK